MAGKKARNATPILIRREEVIEAGHHGGAWKVAYADFVTAMMAFFLLMWLVNATTDKQRRGIADYFSPVSSKAHGLSGSGKPFGGVTPFEKGAQVSTFGAVSVSDQVRATSAFTEAADATDQLNGASSATGGGKARFDAATTDPDAVPVEGDNRQDGNSGTGTVRRSDDTTGDDGAGDGADATRAAVPDLAVPARPAPPAAEPSVAAREQDRLADAAASLRAEIAADPSIGDAARQLTVDVTPEGLRIQITDTEHAPMFDGGSALPNRRARLLLGEVAPVLARLDQPVSITGHTDDAPCRGTCQSNWALSAGRADASRLVLDAAGLPDRLVSAVSGVADRDPMPAENGDAADNRRIVLVVKRPTPPPAASAPPPPRR